MNEYFEKRKAARAAAISAFAQGRGEIRQRQNLTAKIALTQLCEAEHRQPTPQEIEATFDFEVVPTGSNR